MTVADLIKKLEELNAPFLEVAVSSEDFNPHFELAVEVTDMAVTRKNPNWHPVDSPEVQFSHTIRFVLIG